MKRHLSKTEDPTLLQTDSTPTQQPTRLENSTHVKLLHPPRSKHRPPTFRIRQRRTPQPPSQIVRPITERVGKVGSYIRPTTPWVVDPC